MTVAGLLLAAGGGRRFGQPKAAVAFRGRPLAEHAVVMLRAGGCDPVVAVLGPVMLPLDATVVVNSDWASGMASSLRAGLAALDPTAAAAVVVALADQPLVAPAAVSRLVAAWRGGAVAAVATYADAPRNPVLLDRSVWADVAVAAVGDEGARSWLRAHRELVTDVPCDDAGSPYDIDTVQDLAELEEQG